MKTRKLNVVEPTVEAPREKFTAEKAVDYMKRRAAGDGDSANRQLEIFSQEFLKDPAYALSWSQKVFDFAARKKVCEYVINFFEQMEKKDIYELPTPRKMLEILREGMTDEVLRKARWPEHSTSETSNLMSTMTNAAWADFFAKDTETTERIED